MSITTGPGAVPLAVLDLWGILGHATGNNSSELSVIKGDGDELSLAIEELGSEA